MSGHGRRGRLSVGTCPARSGYCREVFGEVVLVPGRVRPGRHSVGTYSARSGLCREVFGEAAYYRDMSWVIGFMLGHVRQERLIAGT